jgi:hypothetical protein
MSIPKNFWQAIQLSQAEVRWVCVCWNDKKCCLLFLRVMISRRHMLTHCARHYILPIHVI